MGIRECIDSDSCIVKPKVTQQRVPNDAPWRASESEAEVGAADMSCRGGLSLSGEISDSARVSFKDSLIYAALLTDSN